MVFVIVFLEARIHSNRFRFLIAGVEFIAIFAILGTCISRVIDYYHRWIDVIAGALLGGSVALFTALIVGRVLFDYGVRRENYSDFDLDPKRSVMSGIEI